MKSRTKPSSGEPASPEKKNPNPGPKEVIEPRELTHESRFRFRCYPGIPCFTACCSGIRINLTPYDIWRLKNRLGLSYEEFLKTYTEPSSIDRTPLPIVVIRLRDDEEKTCPFLIDAEKGCSVYEDRPSTCRYYPIGRVHMKKLDHSGLREFFVRINEDHCLGHREDREWTVDEWRADQGSDLYDELTHDWLEVVIKAKSLGITEFSKSSLNLFFMVSSNLDAFRSFVFESRFLDSYEIDPELLEKIRTDELELLKFSMAWLRFTLFGEGDFRVREDAKQRAEERLKEKALERKRAFEEREKKAVAELEEIRRLRKKMQKKTG